MGLLLLWACFLGVLAGIGGALWVLVRELRRQLRARAEVRTQPAAAALVAPRQVTLTPAERPRTGDAPVTAPPQQRTGRGLAYLLPSPHASTG